MVAFGVCVVEVLFDEWKGFDVIKFNAYYFFVIVNIFLITVSRQVYNNLIETCKYSIESFIFER